MVWKSANSKKDLIWTSLELNKHSTNSEFQKTFIEQTLFCQKQILGNTSVSVHIWTLVWTYMGGISVCFLRGSFLPHMHIWEAHFYHTCTSERLIYTTCVHLRGSFIPHVYKTVAYVNNFSLMIFSETDNC